MEILRALDPSVVDLESFAKRYVAAKASQSHEEKMAIIAPVEKVYTQRFKELGGSHSAMTTMRTALNSVFSRGGMCNKLGGTDANPFNDPDVKEIFKECSGPRVFGGRLRRCPARISVCVHLFVFTVVTLAVGLVRGTTLAKQLVRICADAHVPVKYVCERGAQRASECRPDGGSEKWERAGDRPPASARRRSHFTDCAQKARAQQFSRRHVRLQVERVCNGQPKNQEAVPVRFVEFDARRRLTRFCTSGRVSARGPAAPDSRRLCELGRVRHFDQQSRLRARALRSFRRERDGRDGGGGGVGGRCRKRSTL
jgi:hypothetical protein